MGQVQGAQAPRTQRSLPAQSDAVRQSTQNPSTQYPVAPQSVEVVQVPLCARHCPDAVQVSPAAQFAAETQPTQRQAMGSSTGVPPLQEPALRLQLVHEPVDGAQSWLPGTAVVLQV